MIVLWRIYIMGIEEIVDRFENELPGYSLVGYEELAFPVFSGNLHCLFQTDRQLPVIEEFVLNYYYAGVPTNQIHNLLGIDSDIVETAWWKLVEAELINFKIKTITAAGLKYLEDNKLDDLEKILIKVNIDGLNGKMKKDSSMLMSRSAVKDQRLRALHPLIEPLEIDDIDLGQVREVVREYRKSTPEIFPGEILDVFYMEPGKTRYKRLYVLVFRDNESIRFQIYDGFQKVDGYEAHLFKLEEKGIPIIKVFVGNYFNCQSKVIDGLKLNSKDKLGPGKVWRAWCDRLKEANNEILLSLPLIDICIPDEQIDNLIEKALEKGVKVEVVFSGQEFLSTNQKDKIDVFLSLRQKFRNLTLTHVPHYLNKFIIVDEKSGVISEFIKNDLYLPISKQGLCEEGFPLTIEDFEIVKGYVNNMRITNLTNRTDLITARDVLEDKLKDIVRQVYTLDEKMRQYEAIGWLGEGSIPEIANLLSSPVAKNENSFKTFINAMNKAFVESLEQATRLNGGKGYFWNIFKNKYPNLQRQLYKIRLYRNYMNHLVLEEKYKEPFFSFLNEDIYGCYPQLVENGYLILQTKMILDLENVLLNQIKELTKT